MSDVYIYYFVPCNGYGGETALSTRPATLEAINGRGRPVMESQIVVDHTELDDAGFLITADVDDLVAANNFAPHLWSLELSESRDAEGPGLTEDLTERIDMEASHTSLSKQRKNGSSPKLGFADRRRHRNFSR